MKDDNNDFNRNDENKKTEIPAWRKQLYYGGNILSGIGFIMFLSAFFAFSDPYSNMQNSFSTPIIGFILVAVGQFLSSIGKKGVAGSGLKLDPEEARKDYEPFTRAGGGMIADAYDEFKSETGKNNEPVIKIRCRNCSKLNDETATYCNNCGERL